MVNNFRIIGNGQEADNTLVFKEKHRLKQQRIAAKGRPLRDKRITNTDVYITQCHGKAEPYRLSLLNLDLKLSFFSAVSTIPTHCTHCNRVYRYPGKPNRCYNHPNSMP